MLKLVEKVEGLILAEDIEEDTIKMLNNLLPVVLLDYYIKGKEIDSVMADNIDDVYRAVKYLIELGHREIGFIHGPFVAPSFRERLDGYKKALSEYGIEFKKSLLREGGAYIGDGYKAMQKLLETRSFPTAVFASNDTMALGVMRAIKKKRLKIPEDISVVGFDDVEFSAHTDPPLTTIRVDRKSMAEEAVKRLMKKMEGENPEPKRIIIPVELIVRESCREVKRETRR